MNSWIRQSRTLWDLPALWIMMMMSTSSGFSGFWENLHVKINRKCGMRHVIYTFDKVSMISMMAWCHDVDVDVITHDTNRRKSLFTIHNNRPGSLLTRTILHPVYDLRARVQIIKKANGYKPWLIDVTFDICEFLRKHNHPFIKVMYNIFRDSSNINHTCPYMVSDTLNQFNIMI